MSDTMPSDEASSEDAPSDDDMPEDGAPAGDGGGEDRPGEPDEARLDQLGEQIRGARATAEETIGVREDQEPAYTESGQDEPEDDQAITPPG